MMGATRALRPGRIGRECNWSGAMLHAIWNDDTGATAIEYGLIAALIAVAIIVALETTGNEISATMTTVSDTMAASNTA